jgi:hypothetical protein
MDFPADVISAPVREFARISGLGESTIWAMIHDGRLETIAIGRRRLVLIDSYRRLIKQQRAEAPKDARRNGTVPALGTAVVKAPREPAGDGALDRRVDEIGLSNRAKHALMADGIEYVGELVERSERDLLQIPNFGRVCLNDVTQRLAKLNLRLGMPLPDWGRRRHVATASAAE